METVKLKNRSSEMNSLNWLNSRPKDTPTYTQRSQGTSMEKEMSLQQVVPKQLDTRLEGWKKEQKW